MSPVELSVPTVGDGVVASDLAVGAAVIVTGAASGFWVASSVGHADGSTVARDHGAQKTSTRSSVLDESDIVTKPPFPKNKAGETYGSSLYTGVLDGPDLMSAYTSDGVLGFVQKEDIVTPAEANGESTTEARDVTVYDYEGKTVVGTLRIDPSYGTMPTPRSTESVGTVTTGPNPG